MYFYNNKELQQTIMNEIKKDTNCKYNFLFIIDIKSALPKNENELKEDIFNLIDKYLSFQKNSIEFISLRKIIVFSSEKREKIEKLIESFLSRSKEIKIV